MVSLEVYMELYNGFSDHVIHFIKLWKYSIKLQKENNRELDKSVYTTTLNTTTHPLNMPQILQWAHLIKLPEMSLTLTSHCLEYYQNDF